MFSSLVLRGMLYALSTWWALTVALFVYQIGVMTQLGIFTLLAVLSIPVAFWILKRSLQNKKRVLYYFLQLLSWLPLVLQLLMIKSPDISNVLSGFAGLLLYIVWKYYR